MGLNCNKRPMPSIGDTIALVLPPIPRWRSIELPPEKDPQPYAVVVLNSEGDKNVVAFARIQQGGLISETEFAHWPSCDVYDATRGGEG